MKTVLGVFVILFILCGCRQGLNKRVSSVKKNNTIMIIDTDFDADLEVFKNKIIGKYTLKCTTQEDEENYLKILVAESNI